MGKRVRLMAAATLVAAMVAESVVRVALPPPRYYESLQLDSELGFRMQPGTLLHNVDDKGVFEYRLSREGFRGPDLPDAGAALDPAEQRLLFLGDSFLNAWAVRADELVGVRVARELSTPQRPVQSFSLCCDDWGTAQELLALRAYGARVRPHAIVLLLFAPNDVINNTPELAGATTVSPGDYLRPYLVASGSASGAASAELARTYAYPGRAALRRVSRCCAWLERNALAYALRTGKRDWLPFEPVETRMDVRLTGGLASQPQYELFQPPEAFPADASGAAARARWQAAWRRTADLLGAVQTEARALGAPLLVVSIPDRVQVEEFAWSLANDMRCRISANRAFLEGLDLERPERELVRVADERALPLACLLTPFRDARRAGTEVYVSDGHLNGNGHAIAARAVVDWLRGAPLVPPFRPADVARADAFGARASSLPDASTAEPRLDFCAADNTAWLSSGFHERQPCEPDGRGGIWITNYAEAVLRHGLGDLVVRGSLPGELPLPCVITVAVPGVRARSHTLAQSGPFELRVDVPQVQYDGYVAVDLMSSTFFKRSGDARVFALQLRTLAFERAPDASGAHAVVASTIEASTIEASASRADANTAAPLDANARR